MITVQKIRFHRLQKGLTQKAMAEKLHIAINTYSDYETGKVIPDMLMFQNILSVLGLDLSLSETRVSPHHPDENSYYTRKEMREASVNYDMEIRYEPLLGFAYDTQPANEKGELASVWEIVSFAYKGQSEQFMHNGVLSNEGMMYVRLYKTKGSVALKKAVFDGLKLVEILDEWATLEEVNNKPYHYIKHREKLEVRITDDEDLSLNEAGLKLFTDEFYERTFFGIAGEI